MNNKTEFCAPSNGTIIPGQAVRSSHKEEKVSSCSDSSSLLMAASPLPCLRGCGVCEALLSLPTRMECAPPWSPASGNALPPCAPLILALHASLPYREQDRRRWGQGLSGGPEGQRHPDAAARVRYVPSPHSNRVGGAGWGGGCREGCKRFGHAVRQMEQLVCWLGFKTPVPGADVMLHTWLKHQRVWGGAALRWGLLSAGCYP